MRIPCLLCLERSGRRGLRQKSIVSERLLVDTVTQDAGTNARARRRHDHPDMRPSESLYDRLALKPFDTRIEPCHSSCPAPLREPDLHPRSSTLCHALSWPGRSHAVNEISQSRDAIGQSSRSASCEHSIYGRAHGGHVRA